MSLIDKGLFGIWCAFAVGILFLIVSPFSTTENHVELAINLLCRTCNNASLADAESLQKLLRKFDYGDELEYQRAQGQNNLENCLLAIVLEVASDNSGFEQFRSPKWVNVSLLKDKIKRTLKKEGIDTFDDYFENQKKYTVETKCSK